MAEPMGLLNKQYMLNEIFFFDFDFYEGRWLIFDFIWFTFRYWSLIPLLLSSFSVFNFAQYVLRQASFITSRRPESRTFSKNITTIPQTPKTYTIKYIKTRVQKDAQLTEMDWLCQNLEGKEGDQEEDVGGNRIWKPETRKYSSFWSEGSDLEGRAHGAL